MEVGGRGGGPRGVEEQGKGGGRERGGERKVEWGGGVSKLKTKHCHCYESHVCLSFVILPETFNV